MIIEPFCGWGDGPDVGINLTRTPREEANYNPLFWVIDLKASEARALAAKLIKCAEQAESFEEQLAEYEGDVL